MGVPLCIAETTIGPTKKVETAALQRQWLVHIVTDIVIDKD